MFFNRLKETVRGTWLKGHQALQQAPKFLHTALGYSKKISEFAHTASAKAKQLEGVYEKNKASLGISPRNDSRVKTTFKQFDDGYQKILRNDKIVQQLGGDLMTLF